jgi:hypothetical protein
VADVFVFLAFNGPFGAHMARGSIVVVSCLRTGKRWKSKRSIKESHKPFGKNTMTIVATAPRSIK